MISNAALSQLVSNHWCDAVASALGSRLAAGETGVLPAYQLAVTATRVMWLDAEDFGPLAAGHRQAWASELAACSFPLTPRDRNRGALGSLLPLYRLMLEVLELRRARLEPQQVVIVAHLIGEYLPLLAWETRLGHAGDPMQMRDSVGERWGTTDSQCPHSSALKSTAKRSLNAAWGDEPGYTGYLDRFHARLGEALAICGANRETVAGGARPDVISGCPNPCAWAVQGTMVERADLDARIRLAMIYRASPLVALRHHAPSGHFFGVPSWAEVDEAWQATWRKLTAPWVDGSNPLTGVVVPAGAGGLPGLAELASAVAGRTISAGSLLQEIGADLKEALTRLEPAD